MFNSSRIEAGRNQYENTGQELESKFLGDIDKYTYNELAYRVLHPIKEGLSPLEIFEENLKIREEAQKVFQNTLDLADKDKYINFKTSMELVEKIQLGDPENPRSFFAKALLNRIKERFAEKYSLKFFSAVGTHFDVVHKIDGFFKLYSIENGEELACATVDITGRESKDISKANVLIKVTREEKEKLDPSTNNERFDKQFFAEKINYYAEKIIAALIDNYKNR